MRRYLIGAVAAVLMTGGLISSAPPARAGCQSAQLLLFPNAQKCDGPIQPDGTWQRCVTYYYAPPNSPPSQSDCHPMGPNKQTIAHPFYDPPTHIGP